MEIRSKRGKKVRGRVVLEDVTARALPGRMLAVMGPSGSGKSSLLHAIVGRVKADKNVSVHGVRSLNGEILRGDAQIPVALVEQETNFFPHMTVKETLDFRVKLKSKSGSKDRIVSDLLQQLSLTKVANTIVGSSKIRGVSGGERKRLSIACEMISAPSIIFLDEPTSGLDSFQANQVVSTLRKLADAGKTVVAVIHQPSQRVFATFDDLLLLSEGKQMYFGETRKVRGYFDSVGYPAAKEVGTAEHIIDCVSTVVGDLDAELESSHRVEDIASKAQAMSLARIVRHNGTSTSASSIESVSNALATATTENGARINIFQQFKLLTARALREVFRGKKTIIINLVKQVTLGIVYGGIYHLGSDQSSVMDRFGLLSLIAIGSANMAIAGTVRAFPKEKAIVGPEISSNMYSTVPYFVAKAVAEIPLLFVYSAVFSSIIYPLCGLQPGRFRTFVGLTSVGTIAGEAVGLLIGSVASNSDVALALMPPVLVLSIIFDGKNISTENIPRALRWIQNVGVVRWCFESLCINEFDGLTFDSSSGPRRGPLVRTGKDALERFGLHDHDLTNAVTTQLKIIAVCWLMSIVGLSFTRQKFEAMKSPNK